jgi:LCP family protein required for cell wall assembly
MGTVAGFVLAVIVGVGSYFWSSFMVVLAGTGHQIASSVSGAGGTDTALSAQVAPPGQPFTVLLLGSDDDSKFKSDATLTQSMILMRVDPTTDQVTMLSIPRDLLVPLSTGGSGKIDAAYQFGGANGAVQTVETDFHVHIDHYVWIGLKGLVNLINLVGGVDVATTHPVLDDYYPADQTSQDPFDYDRIAVLGGAQHMDGLQAMEYVRSRHDDALSDIGRSERQQQVLVALHPKLSQLGITDIPKIAAALQGEFSTDIGLTDISNLDFLMNLVKKVNPANVKHIVLLQPDWQSGTWYGQDVLIPNWSLTLALVHQTFPST